MNQGTVITRIMIGLLFFLVCAYLIFSAIRTLDERSYTVTTYAHTLDDAAETTGLLIRAETVVTGQAAAIVDVLPDQGEKVRSGSPVAYLYQDESALDRRRQLRTLTLEEEQLMYALQGQDGTDASRLDQSIVDRAWSSATATPATPGWRSSPPPSPPSRPRSRPSRAPPPWTPPRCTPPAPAPSPPWPTATRA